MRELSLHILDITENSIDAGATFIEIKIILTDKIIEIEIKDNGCGMSKKFVKAVTDPFTTTRMTRKVGMGIPLFKMAAEMAGGDFKIESFEGVGTTVTATFGKDHIDRAPFGSIEDTIVTLIASNSDIEYSFTYSYQDKTFLLDTREVKKQLGKISIAESEVLTFLKEMVKENILSINGGMVL